MDREFTTALRSGEPVAGSWISIGHPQVAEITSLLGFGFVVIDTEHTPNSLETVENMVRAVECHESSSIVRVPWNDPVRIKRTLDIGPDGLLIPMIETEGEARAAVESMQYPPDGIRGMASSRASEYGLQFDEYVATANERRRVDLTPLRNAPLHMMHSKQRFDRRKTGWLCRIHTVRRALPLTGWIQRRARIR